MSLVFVIQIRWTSQNWVRDTSRIALRIDGRRPFPPHTAEIGSAPIGRTARTDTPIVVAHLSHLDSSLSYDYRQICI
jgi:hypothetical protein